MEVTKADMTRDLYPQLTGLPLGDQLELTIAGRTQSHVLRDMLRAKALKDDYFLNTSGDPSYTFLRVWLTPATGDASE